MIYLILASIECILVYLSLISLDLDRTVFNVYASSILLEDILLTVSLIF